MIEQVNEKIDVLVLSRRNKGVSVPIKIRWKNKVFQMKKMGLHHPVHEGRVLYHIYEGTDGHLQFRLKFNTETTQWTLEAVTDGLPS